MLNFIRSHKALSALIFVNIIAIIIVAIVIIIHYSKSAVLDIVVAPESALIEINGKKYDNRTSVELFPGDYTATISMDGMTTKTVDFSLTKNGFTRLHTYLLDSEGGFKYYLSHPSDEALLAKVVEDGDTVAKDFVTSYDKLYAISEVLPLTFANTFDPNATEVVSINISLETGEQCSEGGFCLIVHDFSGKNHEKALSMIREAGYNPDDYEIVFKKYGE